MIVVIVIKIGGALITDKRKPFSLRHNVLQRLAKEIALAYKECCREMVVIHGGGSYGHFVVHEYGFNLEGEGFYMTVKYMRELNQIFVDYLHSAGIPAIPVDTHAIALRRGEHLYLFLDTVACMIRKGLIPVLYGDAIVGEVNSVLSGDEIAWFIARELGAERLVFATEVAGIFDRDPSAPGARLINELKLSDVEKLSLGASKGIDVTGGMSTKLRLGLIYRSQRLRDVLVVGGELPGNVYRALCGLQVIGTKVIV